MRRVQGILVSLVTFFAYVGMAKGGTLYDSGSFEAPRFTTAFVNPYDPTVVGNLRGQDSAVSVWMEATADPNAGPNGNDGAASGTAVVESKAGGSGGDLQDVKVTRTQYDDYWTPTVTYTENLTNPVVIINWSMAVAPTLTNPSNYGPFFGITAFNGTTPITGFGVDATTGELLYEDPTLGLNTTTNDNTVPLSSTAYKQFSILLNYATQQATFYLNGIPVESNINFLNPVSGLTYAEISALQAAPTAQANQAGVAYFDNYSVTSVPEPASLGGLVLVGAFALARRRRRD